MKINEVTTKINTYLATVRVVLRGNSSTARTTIAADGSSNALLMLTRLYGVGNVLSISQIVSESPRTDQIQQETMITPPVMQRRIPLRKHAHIQSSKVTARPIANQLKRDLVRQKLTTQLMRQSNTIKPTQDDVRVARNRAATELKRADLEYQKAMDRALRRGQ